MTRLLRARQKDEAGLGMILVIGISVFLFTLAVAAATIAVSGVTQSRKRTSYEQSLATAESGIDGTMSKLQTAFSQYSADFPIPNNTATLADPTPACNAARVTWPATLGGVTVSDSNGNFIAAGGKTATQNEKAWAKQQLVALESVSGCINTSPGGQYVVLKPVTTTVAGSYPKYGKIYSLGAVPSFSAPKAQVRLLKAEYLFSPYRPTNAILTGSDLKFQGSLTVTGAAGVDPSLAGVHANGDITVIGSSGNVTGEVSYTGSMSGSIGASNVQSPAQSIPRVSARDYYFQAPSADPSAMSDWYDLCNDGTVRAWSSGGPCTSTTIYATGSFRGWSYSTPSGDKVWTANRDALDGTYFAYQTNVTNGTGNASFANMSVFAASANPTDCATKQYGNIDWNHYDIAAPAFHSTWFYADGDVRVTANIKIGQGATTPPIVSGSITSGDQTYLYTQSNSAVGNVVAADKCKATQPVDSLVSLNEVHSDLYYDPNADTPFTSIITNTLWLDYSTGT